TLTLTGLKAGKVYYIVADGPNGPAFGKGAYRLYVQAGSFAIPSPGAGSPASDSGAFAALALVNPHPGNDDDIQVRDLQAPRIEATFAGDFHLHAPVKRRITMPLRIIGALSSEEMSHGSGRRRGSQIKEARLLAKAGLLVGRFDS